nr:glycerol-3-phosphate phosphatase-like [Halyomorpha halys]
MAARKVTERSLFALSTMAYRNINFTVRAMSTKMIDFNKLDNSQMKQFKEKYDSYIFDWDGCLISFENKPFEGVKDVIQEIEKNKKGLMVLTNNCLHTVGDLGDIVHGHFPSINKENVKNSGYFVVNYLKKINFDKKIYAIGTECGVITDLKDNSFDVVYDKEIKSMSLPFLNKIKFDKDVEAVLIAGDPNLNYLKMLNAVNYLKNPKVLFLQSHIPTVVRINANLDLPVAGATVEYVKAASGRKETICVGKGGEYFTEYMKSLGLDHQRTLFVGDDISSDILAGNLACMDTMLVLTGNSTLEMVEQDKCENHENKIPTYYTNSVADLIKLFKVDG